MIDYNEEIPRQEKELAGDIEVFLTDLARRASITPHAINRLKSFSVNLMDTGVSVSVTTKTRVFLAKH